MNEEKNQNDTNMSTDFDFLQEKIKERPINKKKLIKKTILTASMAVLFGLLACLSFLFLEPLLNNWLYPEEEPEVVAFPQEQNEMLPEDMLTEGTTASETETESEEESTQTDMTAEPPAQAYPFGEKNYADNPEPDNNAEQETEEPEPLKSYMTQYDELYKVYREVATSMVTVTAVRSDVDWFNNTYQSEGTTAGVIIANNNKELLILSRKSPLDNAETIRISFCNGVSADAQVKQYDENTDIAVLAVDLKYIGNSTLEYVTVATLGSSASSIMTGVPVIAVGNLFGYKDSVCYGIVTSKDNTISLADSEYKLITTDIYAGTSPSGILVNMDKEVIGIVDNSYNKDDTKNLLSAVGITELKGMITKLSNGDDIPYLGIYAQDISAQTRNELGLPKGAYIFDIDMHSPALLNGIQKGDFIVQVGSQEIETAADYMNALRNASTERDIKIVVQRASLDDYEEMEFMIQPSKSE
jgi:serine protease Do